VIRSAVGTLLALSVVGRGFAHERITTDVTYDREVVRILRDHCASCHGPGTKVPLMSYAEARPWAKAIRDEVEGGRMPPWSAARGVGDLDEREALAPRAVEILVAWAEGGAPQGDARDLPASLAAPAAPTIAGDVLPIRGARTLRAETVVIAVRPQAPAKGSVEVRAQLPDGTQRPLVWVPRFEQKYARTYGLREPLRLPAGTRVTVFGSGASAELRVTGGAPSRAP
jgi:hypothetical protein